MKFGKAIGIFFFLLPFFLIPNSFANEPSVSIQVIGEAVPGREIVVQVTITHSANSFLHHVEWVDVVINREQSTRWAYSAMQLPPAASFKKEVRYKVPPVEEIHIWAEAACIRHGSPGKVTLTVPVKK